MSPIEKTEKIRGFEGVKIEKIGLLEWLPVRKHSRTSVLKLREEDVIIYDIQAGDQVQVELRLIRRLVRTPPEEEASK